MSEFGVCFVFCILQFRKEGIEHLENGILGFPLSVIARNSFGI